MKKPASRPRASGPTIADVAAAVRNGEWRRRPRIRRDHRPHDGPGERLRQVRIAKGLTQEELGNAVGRSRSYILQIERGAMNPSEEVALGLEDVLQLPGLFDLRPCPCVPWCGVRTVGGGFAVGHRLFTDEERARGGHKNKGRRRPDQSERIRAANRERWRTGVALREFVRSWSGESRRKWLGRWGGRAAGRLGGRKRGYTEAHVQVIRILRKRDSGIGRVRLARLSGLTEKQVRAILSEIEG